MSVLPSAEGRDITPSMTGVDPAALAADIGRVQANLRGGPSTGTPGPSRAASEAQEGVLRSIAASIRPAFPDAADLLLGLDSLHWPEEAHRQHQRATHLGGEVARLREAATAVIDLCSHDEVCPAWDGDNPCDPTVCAFGRLLAVLASVDAPAPNEADDCEVHCDDPSCAAPAVPAEGDEVVASDGVAFREAFVDAVLDEPVSWEVGNLTLTVGDVVQIARWFAPVAERLAAVWPVPAPDESR